MNAVAVRPPPILGPASRAEFAANGFVVAPQFIAAAGVAKLRAAVNEVAAAGAEFTRDTARGGVRYQVQTATGRAGEAVRPGLFRKIMYPSRVAAPLRQFRDGRAVQGALAELGVSKPRCVLDQVNLKAAGVGTGFPWHQDALFLAPLHQAAIANFGGVNLVLALDEADERNGGFAVLEGTHTLGPLNFDYDIGGDNAELERLGPKRAVNLRPGDAAFFHPYLLHGSGRNDSGRDRSLITLWFIDDR